MLPSKMAMAAPKWVWGPPHRGVISSLRSVLLRYGGWGGSRRSRGSGEALGIPRPQCRADTGDPGETGL